MLCRSLARRASFGLVASVFATVVPALADDAPLDLSAVARSSERPRECGGGAHGVSARWDRARTPGLGAYCDALARGYAALRRAPDEARAAAARADKLLPGKAAPLVLAARAAVASGQYKAAFDVFERARGLERGSLDSPGSLHDYAVSALRSERPGVALEAYRALVPRAELLDDDREEIRVFVEAAVLSMSVDAKGVSEAIGYLTEARRIGSPIGMTDYVLAALALAYDRQGRGSEARGVAEAASGPLRLESERERGALASLGPALPEGELDALIATLAEGREPELAAERWRTYLERAGSGPWAAHARAHRDASSRKGKGAH